VRGLDKVRLALWAIIIVLASAAVYISFTVVARQNALQEVSRYNIAWVASQAVNEIARLEERVAAFGLGNGAVDKDEVKLRFEIVQNRLGLLQDGSISALTDRDLEYKRVIDELGAAIMRIDPLIDRIEQPGSVDRVIEVLRPFEEKLGRLAAAANNFGGEQVAEDQHQLLHLHWIFSALAGGLLLCNFVLIALLFRTNNGLRTITDDLRIAKGAAEAASVAKTQFLAMMSHELRTPLNAIIGFSDIMVQEMLGPIGVQKYREYSNDILRSGSHMLEVISDILTMSKLEAGHLKLSIEVLDLHQIVQSCLAIVRGTEVAQGREIIVAEGAHWVSLWADEKAVRQMLLNLLSNALKFSGADSPVVINCQRAPDDALWLSVSDRGIGMTKAEAALAVQPFQQVDNGIARKYEGSGLGLSIVSALIESHSGRLVIESERGQGSCISLVFPEKAIEATGFANGDTPEAREIDDLLANARESAIAKSLAIASNAEDACL
jgi:two-component system, cell cycle sensor histidine kinase PleC